MKLTTCVPYPLVAKFNLVLALLITYVQSQSTSSTLNATTNLSDCSNPVYGSCAFYPDCLESRFHCGPTGYPLGYGLKYCTKFSQERSKLSTAGQTWMLNTMHCLQTALIPEATGEVQMTCQELEETAFETHAGCYIGSGLCKLSPEDWVTIVGIVGVKTLVGSWDAVKETLEAAGDCAEFIVFATESAIKKDIGEL
ncbi:hypothetical protein NEOLEDRAFT_1138874 [Neolentinus lepideus HHB14362 ss-1]|uniref:Uncharacterized protein n=1 Tax=Neolentinus lepideus HHB14362 ss-1 TaxID=1314782 RepID=A0A165Q3A8_9AGAM|nr:hypothetical protein NEOLEDRAFT_1138874 [Neolentinus lepideus HHB14362 ss-1]